MNIGDTAPDFTLPSDSDGEVSLSTLKGNIVIIYFYPKDMTPGCTTQAIAFSSHRKDFDALGAKIIGISKDTPARHDKFIAKHDLTITLASDEDGEMMENYGVWVLKKLYGREYMGIERSTFLISADGKIAEIWRKVRVKNHVEAVLERTRELAQK
jgi:peroxiredoxin Q/BCP